MAKASEVLIYIKDKLDLKGLATLQTKLAKLRTNIKAAFNSAPVRAFRNAVLAVGAAFVAAVVEGARFNVQMARVWTMAGGGIENFKSLRKEARGLAADFGKARSEIATGMYTALSAGVDRSNLESFMRTAAQVAVADGSEISVAVDGITTVLNAFHIEAEDTERVTDLLFQTVKTGKTTFGELSSSLSNVASTAASSGVPLKEVLAHIAALTAQGTPAAQATTQIRASIIGLNKALGDGWSNGMNYQDALKKVWEQSNKSPKKLLKLVGSTEAMAAVLGGVGENAKTAADKLAGMEDAAGAAKKAFDKVDQFRHWPKAIESARGFLSKFGEELNVRIAPFVDKVTKKIKEWTQSEVLWEKIRDVMDAAADRLQAAGAAVKTLVSQINSLSDLKVLAETIGDWLKVKLEEGGKLAAKFLLEKAPVIGDLIAKSLLSGFGGKLEDMAVSQEYATQEMGPRPGLLSGKRAEYDKRHGDLVSEALPVARSQRLGVASEAAAALVEFSPAGKQTFEEMLASNLEKRDAAVLEAAALEYDIDRAAAVSEVLDMASSGMSTDEIKGIIESWGYVQEDTQALMDSLEASADAADEVAKVANEMQEATAKSLDATAESNKALTVALDNSAQAAVQSAQTAETSTKLINQVLTLQDETESQVAQLIGVVGELKQRLDQQDYEIQALKV